MTSRGGIGIARRKLLAGAAFGLLGGGCARGSSGRDRDRTLVFKHQPLWGDPAPFHTMIAAFERDVGVRVVSETLPNASDIVHQYYLTSFEGSADFDVLVADVVWVAELARAGWIADLSQDFPTEKLAAEMLPGVVETTIADGRTHAVPWYVDVGLMYRRVDLVPEPPRTYDQLAAEIAAARSRRRDLEGWLWQGKQYEGLVCNAYESIWGHGGASMLNGRLALDTPPAREGIAFLRGAIESGASPTHVLSAAEEESRRAFQSGRAVFMRNWPYAWNELEHADSPVRGRVAVSPLPTASGETGAGALGGWLLAINARSPSSRRSLAVRLIAHLTSLEANVAMALHYARTPPRRAAYEDERTRAGAPFIASLLPMVARARPRPVTPWYGALTDMLQGELSAAVAGVRSPAEALARAQVLSDRMLSRLA
jgi:multiple sugar transport system substrate-binding protein